MAFSNKDPIQSKICLNNKILERVNEFNYLGYNLYFNLKEIFPRKLTSTPKTMSIINSIFKPSYFQQHTRLRLYNTLARPVLSYGSEAWTLRNHEISRITACEIRFMRTAGYTKFDHKRNEDVLKQLKVTPVMDYIWQYQENWRNYVHRMSNSRYTKAILKYHPAERRSVGRPHNM